MDKIRILFVCHGNICRSPMAQCVLTDMVEKKGMAELFEIDSAAMTSEELGNPIYPATRRMLESQGIPIIEHRARRFTKGEVDKWDLIIGMDDENMRMLKRVVPQNALRKVYKLMEFAGVDSDVADPWWTGDQGAAFDDIVAGCRALLASLRY